MYLREADVEDALQICDLYADVASYYGFAEDSLDFDNACNYIDDNNVVIAVDEDLETLLGVICYHFEWNFHGKLTVWVDGLIATPNSQYAGKRLLEHVIEVASEGGAALYILPDVDANGSIFVDDYLDRMGFLEHGTVFIYNG